jgi:drug/metabolite transporter (DMT)-like permease
MSQTQRAGSGAMPWLAFAAISFIWGSTWLAHKWALQDFTPIGLMTLRMGVAAIVFASIAWARRESLCTLADLKHVMLAGFVLTCFANVATAWSLTYIPSGVGAILQAPIPVWMALLSFRTDPLSKTGWLASFMGLFGVALVCWPDNPEAKVHLLIPVVPSLVCVLTAAIWSWASMHQRKYVRSGGLFANASLQMTQGALIGGVAIAAGAGFTVDGTISREAWASVAYLIGFGSCIAFAAFLYLTQVWHPARAGSFSYLNPLIAVLLGWWLNAEMLNAQIIVGLVIILLSVGVLQIATIRARRKAAIEQSLT